MKTRTTLSTLLFGTATTILMIGCVALDEGSPTASTQSIPYKLPTLTHVEADKQQQEKEGIRISVAPYSFSAQQKFHNEYRQAPSIIVVNDQYPAQRRKTVYLEVEPRRVRLKVKINNQLERVLRLAGTVVVFQVAGKTVPIEKAAYENFLGGIILPRQEMEYDIAGPDIGTLPDNAVFAFLLYDIVTATDAAGNPTKRSNFEWIFSFAKEAKTAEVPAPTFERVLLNRPAAEELLQKEGQTGNWVRLNGL